jgi:O-antigen ligase
VENAHSLYVETYAELGLVGLILLVASLVTMLIAAVRMVIRSRYEDRTAAVAAALVAFLLGAAFDWLWQMPVLPATILLLVGAVLAPASHRGADRSRSGLVMQVGVVVAGLACLVAIAYPLATSSAVASSVAAADVNNLAAALSDAQSAVRLEPGSAPAELQLALVYETQHEYGRAVASAKHAVSDEPQNWANWLILSRLQAEDHNAHGALVSYVRAKSLNPQSSLFRES